MILGNSLFRRNVAEYAALLLIVASHVYKDDAALFFVTAESAFFRNLLESAPLRWMGRISYGLYLWQQLFLVPQAGAFLPRVALTFAAAAASYYLMERPLLRYAREPGRNWNRQVLWNNEFFAENAERYPRLRQEV